MSIATPAKAVLFVLLIVAGAGAPAMFLLRPVWALWVSRDWRETPCIVLASGFTQGGNARGDRVNCHIRYVYQSEGRDYQGDALDLFPGSGDRWNLAVVEANPSGTRSHCFVDRHDPKRSVFRRSLATQSWIVGIFSCCTLVLTWLGVAGLRDLVRPAEPRKPTTTG